MQRELATNILWGALAAGLLIVAGWDLPRSADGAEPKHCPAGTVAASWYGRESGHKTAAGRFFNGEQWIVAHKTMRLGTMLRLTYGGKSITVPVGDRGPYIKGRTLDLSERVARALGTKGAGVACVGMERL